MEPKTCPRCDTPMLEAMDADGHYQCPVCDLYLSAWAFPIVEKAYIEREDEATAQYSLPFMS